MKKIFSIFLLILLFIPPASSASQTRLIKISGRYAQQLRLAVDLFNQQEGNLPRMGTEITNLLIDDLLISGFFEPVKNKSFIAEASALDRKTGKINLKEWSSLGVEILIKGSYRIAGGEITIQCRAIRVLRGEQVYGKKYTGDLSRWREIIHTIADEIVMELTGNPGLARTEIAFVSLDGNEKKIYRMEAAGHIWRRVETGPGFALFPEWGPDGKTIYYTSYRTGFPWIYRDNLATKKRTVLSRQPGLNAFPAVSPDGRWLAFTLSRDGNNEIYKMRMDTTGLKRLTFSRANECSPSWSPDGKKIAYTSDRTGSPQIYIMDSDGKNPRRITRQGGYNTSPAWSPRGDLLAFSSRIGGDFKIKTVNLKTGKASVLTDSRGNDEDPAWAPDGRHLVYTSRRGKFANLYVLDILNPDPVRITSSRICQSPAWSPYQNR